MSLNCRLMFPYIIAFIDDNCEGCWQLTHYIIDHCESANDSGAVVDGKSLAVVVVRTALKRVDP